MNIFFNFYIIFILIIINYINIYFIKIILYIYEILLYLNLYDQEFYIIIS